MSTFDPQKFGIEFDDELDIPGDTRQETGQLVAWMLPESTLAKLRSYSAAKQQHQFQVVAEALEHYMALKKVQ
jgi:hypothetical protein